jgi:hypothetical protein
MTYLQFNEISSANTDKGQVTFRLQSVDHLPLLAQEESCHIIKQYFDFLDAALTTQGDGVDIVLLQDMLLEISELLRSGKSQLRADGYLRLLDRLTAIYAKGLRADDNRAFARTAANFADILESVSQFFQDYDYSQSVGLLLHYMDKLFNYHEEGWIEVLEHLLSMPDSIRIMQQLRSRHLEEIQNWVEEGVDNLFSIRSEQLELISDLEQTLDTLDTEIFERHRILLLKRGEAERRGIIELDHQREKLEIEALHTRCCAAYVEREAKLELVNLLDVNIREFAERLSEMRRSTLMKLVWSNPDLS